MRSIRLFSLAAMAAFTCMAASPTTQAQINVSIGAAPNCPYGYYEAAPYNCAPYGYYGPEWFSGGVFVGAGQWFHGPENFHGSVNNHFSPDHGYKGALPAREEKAEPSRHIEKDFKGNEQRDGRGHEVNGKH
jgi:hypothetical protein